MKNSKLIKRLALLEKKEVKSFLRFAESPYHNANKKLVVLLKYLTRYYPDFNQSKLSKKVVFSKIHKQAKPYNEGRINLLMTQLMSLLEAFWVFEAVKNNAVQYHKLSRQAAAKRHLDTIFTKSSKKQKKKLQAARKNAHFYLESFLLNKDCYNYMVSAFPRKAALHFEASLKQLDHFYLWEKMRLLILSKNRGKTLNESHKLRVIKALMKQMKTEIEASSVLSSYKNLITLMDTKDEDLLTEMLADFEALIPKLNTEEQQIYWGICINMAAAKMRNGNLLFKDVVLDMYQKGLALGFLVQNKQMQGLTFVNIVSIASACGEFDWTKAFMKKHKDYLNAREKENVQSLASAFLNYHKAVIVKDKDSLLKVIGFIQKVHFTKRSYFYRAKTLLLRSYYDYYQPNHYDDYKFMLSQAVSFENQLRRNKEKHGNKLDAFLHFTFFFKKLLKINLNPKDSTIQLEAIRKKIVKMDKLFSKDWLLEKTGELENSPANRL